jgi:hypothetical protein
LLSKYTIDDTLNVCFKSENHSRTIALGLGLGLKAIFAI